MNLKLLLLRLLFGNVERAVKGLTKAANKLDRAERVLRAEAEAARRVAAKAAGREAAADAAATKAAAVSKNINAIVNPEV